MAMSNEYLEALSWNDSSREDLRTAGARPWRRSEVPPPQTPEAQPLPDQGGQPASREAEVRQQAATLIADALLQAEQMVREVTREADLGTVRETIAALRSLGEYVERCVDSLVAERAEIEHQVQVLRGLVQELTETIRTLRGSETGPWGPEGAESVPAPGAVPEEPVAPAPTFPIGAPLTLLVHEVSNFTLLVHLERLLSSYEAVESAGIESYQEEQARFVLALRQPVTANEVRDMVAAELGCAVEIEKADPEWGELILKLEPALPSLAA